MTGNHDYYSGARGFYGLVDRLNTGPAKQAASYFCLRSEDDAWQIIGVDTGPTPLLAPTWPGSAGTFNRGAPVS